MSEQHANCTGVSESVQGSLDSPCCKDSDLALDCVCILLPSGVQLPNRNALSAAKTSPPLHPSAVQEAPYPESNE